MADCLGAMLLEAGAGLQVLLYHFGAPVRLTLPRPRDGKMASFVFPRCFTGAAFG